MRIAAFILGILVSAIMGLQSCAVFGLGGLASSLDKTDTAVRQSAGGGAVGLFATVLSLIAMAFVLGVPMVATVIYVLAALIAFAASSSFPDMKVWAVAMLILAAMTFFSRRKKLALQQQV
jgi:hypothetical protein